MNEISIIKEGHEAILTYLKLNCRSEVILDRYLSYGVFFEEYLKRKEIYTYTSPAVTSFQNWITVEANAERITRKKFIGLMRYSTMISDFYNSRSFQTKYSYGNRYKYPLNIYFEGITEEYVQWLNVGANSKAGFKSSAREFLFFLQERNIHNLAELNTQIIIDYFVAIRENHKCSMNNVMVCLRKLLDFLEEKSYTTCNRNQILRYKTARSRIKVYPAFSSEDIIKLLKSPDRSTVMGKRDYAILFLASVTGLRAIDIANLKLDNLFRNDMTICFSQHKTGRENIIPLDAVTMEVIDDYLAVRPETNSSYIFLTCTKPAKKLNDLSSVRNILVKYTKIANISKRRWDGKGFQAFRRGMGLWLLEDSCDTHLISQILGHKNEMMLKHYLPMSAEALRVCALDLCLIPVKSEVYK